MALEWSQGFESGTPATVFDAVGGTPTFVTDFPASGLQALRCPTPADVGRKNLSTGSIKVIHARFRISAFHASSDHDILRFQNSAGTNTAALTVLPDADRRCILTYNLGSYTGSASTALSLNTYYQVTFYVDASANPWTMDWQLNGAEMTGGAPATAAASFDRVFIGPLGSTGSFDVRIDSVAVYDSLADWVPSDPWSAGLTAPLVSSGAYSNQRVAKGPSLIYNRPH